MKNNIVWHYTTGSNFRSIVSDGQLLAAAESALAGEKPILWFSAHPHWEPTACKGWSESKGGRRITLTMEGTRQKDRGLVRFGIDRRRLHQWPKIGHKARISRQDIRSMEQAGREQGATPSDWYGTTISMSLEKITRIDVMDESGEWVNVRPGGES